MKMEEMTMGLFADDKLQDDRLTALENYVRLLTETQHATQAELFETRIELLKLRAGLDEKVSATDVDPTIVKLNKELGEAREELSKVTVAAEEGWNTLQAGASDALESLRTSVREAYDKLKEA
jgi:hypothetical protein